MTELGLEENIVNILSEFGIKAGSLIRLKEGRNSRVWKVVNKKTHCVVKEYGIRNKDSSLRLQREFSFLELLQENGIKNVPAPLFFNNEKKIGVFSFLEGTPVTAISDSHISSCVKFLYEINNLKYPIKGKKLSDASEAFFCIDDHLNCVKGRLNTLSSIKKESEQHKLAVSFIEESLVPEFENLKSIITRKIDPQRLKKKISLKERIISPSDFGFHNIIETEEGLSFLDFEYAGWDDCAKTICDFGCQPEKPISLSQKNNFLKEVTSLFLIKDLEERAALLDSLYKLKWCCILLNEFRKEAYHRRIHSMGDGEDLLLNQLNKAKQYFKINLGEN